VKPNDRDLELGMDQSIARRDFLNGVAAVSLGSMLPVRGYAGAPDLRGSSGTTTEVYPPRRTGMRGNQPGSFDVSHQLSQKGRRDWGIVREATSDSYDLIVVGAGISGLSAAHFYLKENPDARILIIDNHDDFGGHARRNEFKLGDRTVLSHGGSQCLQEPGYYSKVTRGLLNDLGVVTRRLAKAFHQRFYRDNGLTDGTFFDRSTYGVDRVVRFPLSDYSTFLPLAPTPLTAKEAVAQMPLSSNSRRELLRLLEFRTDQLPGVPAAKQRRFLSRISYRDFLGKHLGVSEPELFNLFQGMTKDACCSIETASAMEMLGYMGLPGLNATAIANYKALDQPYIYHFPDGNASIARLLVRGMIPHVAPGTTMEDIVDAPFDYARLDQASSKVRLRLESTAVRVEHDGPIASAKRVGVTYVRGGQAYRVWGRSCVLAGYNSMIQYLCPELPPSQREALAASVKSPIYYTSVLLRDWHAWKNLGIGCASAPGAYYSVAFLNFPVSLGGCQHAQNPDQPIIVNMERFPKGDDHTASYSEQLRAGRHEMYDTSFETIERNTRTQLAGMLSSGGFDPARDIKAITVNRWAHGYANRSAAQDGRGAPPHVIGRKRLGRIVIANSDAGGRALMDCAIDQAHRAISELNS
jgi:spermidine dehydrogenase